MIITDNQRDAVRVALYRFLQVKIAEYPMATTMIGDKAMRQLADEGTEVCCDAIDDAGAKE